MAPEPVNLAAVFHFLVKELRVLKYQEHYDYTLGYNYGSMYVDCSGGGSGGKNQGKKAGSDSTKCVVSMTVHNNDNARGGRKLGGGHGKAVDDAGADSEARQAAQRQGFAGAKLVAINKAAAIPLLVLRRLVRLSPNHGGGGWGGGGSPGAASLLGNGGGGGGNWTLTFLSSTINGYQGTGRMLSLKLIKELCRTASSGGGMRGAGGVSYAARRAGANIVGSRSRKGEVKAHERWWAAKSTVARATSSSQQSMRRVD
jgi:N-acetyltransferase 10